MSSRHARRVLGANELDDASSEDEVAAPKARPMFAVLDESEGASDDSDAQSDDGEGDVAASKVQYEAPAGAPMPAPQPSAYLPNRAKRELQRQAARSAHEDVALAPHPSPAAAQAADADAPEASAVPADPWRLSAVHVDVSVELGRLFGRQTVRQAGAEQRRERGHTVERGYAAAAARLRERTGSSARGRLIKARDTWPALTGGLSMDVDHEAFAMAELPVAHDHMLTTTLSGGSGRPPAEWFRFTHSSAYRASQAEVDECIESGDPRGLQVLVQRYPCQLDALLRLGEYCAKVGQHEMATELCERVRASRSRRRTQRPGFPAWLDSRRVVST